MVVPPHDGRRPTSCSSHCRASHRRLQGAASRSSCATSRCRSRAPARCSSASCAIPTGSGTHRGSWQADREIDARAIEHRSWRIVTMMEQSAAKDQHGLALSSRAIPTTGGGSVAGDPAQAPPAGEPPRRTSRRRLSGHGVPARSSPTHPRRPAREFTPETVRRLDVFTRGACPTTATACSPRTSSAASTRRCAASCGHHRPARPIVAAGPGRRPTRTRSATASVYPRTEARLAAQARRARQAFPQLTDELDAAGGTGARGN